MRLGYWLEVESDEEVVIDKELDIEETEVVELEGSAIVLVTAIEVEIDKLVPLTQLDPLKTQPFLHVKANPVDELQVAACVSRQLPQKSGVTK